MRLLLGEKVCVFNAPPLLPYTLLKNISSHFIPFSFDKVAYNTSNVNRRWNQTTTTSFPSHHQHGTQRLFGTFFDRFLCNFAPAGYNGLWLMIITSTSPCTYINTRHTYVVLYKKCPHPLCILKLLNCMERNMADFGRMTLTFAFSSFFLPSDSFPSFLFQ